MRFSDPQTIDQATLAQLGLPGRLTHDRLRVTGVSDIYSCEQGDLVFIEASHLVARIGRLDGVNVITTEAIFKTAAEHQWNCSFLVTADPFAAFTLLIDALGVEHLPAPTGTDDTAIVLSTSIGAGSYIGPGCYVGPRVTLGNRVALHPNVTLRGNVSIGNDVIVQAGAVIGALPFCYSRERILFPAVGAVVVSDRVHIGANTVIDRSSFRETTIGPDTKIDNHVHIAHDVRIGARCLIMAHAAITGQATIGDDVTIRGMAGVLSIVDVADRTDLRPFSGLTQATEPGGDYIGMPARRMQEFSRRRADRWLSSYYRRKLDDAMTSQGRSARENMRQAFDLVRSFTGLERIRSKDRLDDLRLDSLDRMELAMILEEHFQVSLSDTLPDEVETVRDVVEHLDQLLQQEYSR